MLLCVRVRGVFQDRFLGVVLSSLLIFIISTELITKFPGGKKSKDFLFQNILVILIFLKLISKFETIRNGAFLELVEIFLTLSLNLFQKQKLRLKKCFNH